MTKGFPKYWHMTHGLPTFSEIWPMKQGPSPDFINVAKKSSFMPHVFLGWLQEKVSLLSRFYGNREKNRGSIYLQKSMKRVRTSYDRNYQCCWSIK